MKRKKALSIDKEAIEKLRAEEARIRELESPQSEGLRLIEGHLRRFPLAESPLEIIESFVSPIMNGHIPSTDNLVFVADGFLKYLGAAGAISLDEAFGLNPRQSSGNPSRRRVKDNKRAFLHLAMWKLRAAAQADGQPISIESAAGEVINRFDSFAREFGQDGLAKSYSKMRVQERFDARERDSRDLVEKLNALDARGS